MRSAAENSFQPLVVFPPLPLLSPPLNKEVNRFIAHIDSVDTYRESLSKRETKNQLKEMRHCLLPIAPAPKPKTHQCDQFGQ
jgi:hypothetical protein